MFFYIRAKLKYFVVGTVLLQIIVSSKDLVPSSVFCGEKEARSLCLAVVIHRCLLVGNAKKTVTPYKQDFTGKYSH